jgi:hypothetical protein
MSMNLRRNNIVTRAPRFLWLTTLFFALSLTTAQAANVESLSNDVLIHQGENAFWQATVKCEGSSTEIPIKQARQEQDWCAETSLLPCAQSKLEMANQVCLNIDVFDSRSQTASTPPAAPVRNNPPAASRPTTNQQNRQAQARAELAAAIRAEEEEIQKARRQLESERRLVEQADRELTQQERELEAQLRELEN